MSCQYSVLCWLFSHSRENRIVKASIERSLQPLQRLGYLSIYRVIILSCTSSKRFHRPNKTWALSFARIWNNFIRSGPLLVKLLSLASRWRRDTRTQLVGDTCSKEVPIASFWRCNCLVQMTTECVSTRHILPLCVFHEYTSVFLSSLFLFVSVDLFRTHEPFLMWAVVGSN